MTSLTIRNLEPDTKDALRRAAKAHVRSMQEEARRILRDALRPARPASEDNSYAQVRAIVAPLGGIDLDLPPRESSWEPPRFD